MTNENFQDEIIVLKVKDWQTADKHAVCFSRYHGKISFIAYGARYARGNGGRLIQPLSVLQASFTSGRKFDTLRSCELAEAPRPMSMEMLAYGAILAEVTEQLTEEHEAQEDIFLLLLATLNLMAKHNKRLVLVSSLWKLLALCGFQPELAHCTTCGKALSEEEDAYFSVVQGGMVCADCYVGSEVSLSAAARNLAGQLFLLQPENPGSFKVRGAELMQVEQVLYKFLLYQIGKPLNSLYFLGSIGL